MDKKFLLTASFGGSDEDGISTSSTAISFFDTIEEALEAAKEDLSDCAYNLAESFCDEDDEEAMEEFANNYIKYYVHETENPEAFLKEVGDSVVILEHEYVSSDDSWSHENIYMLTKLN